MDMIVKTLSQILRKTQRKWRRTLFYVCLGAFLSFYISVYVRRNSSKFSVNGFGQGTLRNLSSLVAETRRQTSCHRFINDHINHTLTDSFMVTLFNSCQNPKLSSASEISKAGFEKLFSADFFNHETCSELAIGRPTKWVGLVALASYRGSGSSWMRYLLEQLTGVQTGTIYNRKIQNFQGDDLCPADDSMFIVKTEEFGASAGRLFKPQCRKNGMRDVTFKKAVYVLRNPFNTFVAGYDFRLENISELDPVRAVLKPKWRSAVLQKTKQWMLHVSWWLSNYKGPVHVILYERLVQSPIWEMYKVSRFLEYPVTLEALACLRGNTLSPHYKDTEFWMTHDTLFMPATTSVIVDAVKRLTPLFYKHGLSTEDVLSFCRFNEVIK